MKHELFMGVIRNQNATARSDNPQATEAEKAYMEAKKSFIAKTMAKLHQTTLLNCECCNLAMVKGFHIHHKDGDHANNEHKNFSIRCPFCHYCEHTGFIGVNNSAKVVTVPELTQAQLNMLQWTVYCTNSIVSDQKKNTKEYMDLIEQQQQNDMIMQAIARTEMTTLREFQTSDPEAFANNMLAMSDVEYNERGSKRYSGLRLLFTESAFKSEIELFKNTIFAPKKKKDSRLHPLNWKSSANLFLKQIKELP